MRKCTCTDYRGAFARITYSCDAVISGLEARCMYVPVLPDIKSVVSCSLV
jgi:hypothetical protein